LSITSKYWGTAGLNYYQIPVTQTAPIDFQIDVFNGGINAQPGVDYSINVNAGAFTASSSTVNVASLDTVTLTVTNPFTPSGLGNYAVVHTLGADSTDDVPANNSIANTNFSVTNYIYARDNGTVAGSTTNGPDGFEAGNLYDIWNQQELKGIDVRMLGGAMNVNKMMALNVPVTLQPNTTYLAVIGAGGPGLRVSNAGTSAPQTSFFFDYADQTWYYQTSTPWVRLNFDPSIGINENGSNIGAIVYPNPANDVLNIKADFKGANSVEGAIYNHLGAVVADLSFTSMNGVQTQQITISDLAPGMYVVKLQSEEGVVTKHFVKK